MYLFTHGKYGTTSVCVTYISDILPWKLWLSQSDMREAIRIGIIGHIQPRHMQSQLQQILYAVSEKSIFVHGAKEIDIEQMVCETIMFLTLEVTRFQLLSTGTTGYRIYKRYMQS